jgi:hypothetical protein
VSGFEFWVQGGRELRFARHRQSSFSPPTVCERLTKVPSLSLKIHTHTSPSAQPILILINTDQYHE